MGLGASTVGNVIDRGAQSATGMEQAPAPSAFDVWTHSYDGMADRMREAAADPGGFLAMDLAQQARVDAAMMPGEWSSSSVDQVADSIAAQASALGSSVGAIAKADGALQTVGATFALLTGVEQMISSVLSVIPFPAFPAVRVTDMDIGLPHGHMHPPNLVPPAPMLPLPSTGPVIPIPILSGATQTLINGMPAARCGDMGLGVWCGGYFPMYEIFLGSSSVWIEGCRAARVLVDITKHCIFTSPKPQDLPVGPMVGTTISSSTNVLIGGVPMPSLLALGLGAALKGLGALLGKGATVFGRVTAPLRRRLFAGLDPGFLKCSILRAEPVNLVTGEVLIDHVDYSIPGYMTLEWTRHYGSQSGRRGVCGDGWCAPADARVVLEDDGALVFYDGADNPVVFPHLPAGAPVRDFVHGAILEADDYSLSVRLKYGHTYRFSRPDEERRETLVAYVEDRCGNYIQYSRDRDGLREISERAGRHIDVRSRDGLIQEMWLRHPDHAEPRLLVRYEYGAAGELVTVNDALGQPYRFSYDRGRLVRHTDRTGLSFCYEYDGPAPTARCCRTYGDGGLYAYRFERDPIARRVTVTDSLGAVSTIQLNELNLPIRETDAAGGITHYHYDGVGRTIVVLDPSNRRTEYEYDRNGNRVRETRPDGAVYAASYDDNGLLTRLADPRGNAWQLEWDASGLLRERVSPRGATWKYSYDTYGALASVTDPLGRVLQHRMDVFGNLASTSNADGGALTFATDLLGNVIEAADPEGRRASYEYDDSGLLLKVTTGGDATVAFAYDAEARMTEHRDAEGHVTRVRYAGLGGVAEVQRPDGTRVQYEYDTEERLTALCNELGQRFLFRYDRLGRMTEEVDYWGQARTYRYDPGGELVESSDPSGRVTKYTRDAAGRLLSKISPGEAPSAYRYDLAGNLVAFTNGSATVRREFDEDNMLATEVQGDFRVEYEHDPVGNWTRRSSSHGHDVRFAYDSRGRVDGIVLDGREIGRFERDIIGRLTHETLNHSLTRSSAYDEDGNLARQTLARHRSTVFERSYKYDARGHLIERQSSTSGVERFGYDSVGRIAWHVDASGQAAAFSYDAAGNLLTEVDAGDGADGLRRVSQDGASYRFDARGNLVEREDARGCLALGWNPDNRLVHSENGGGRTTYHYDAIGRRVRKQGPSSQVRFCWDGDHILSEQRDDGRCLEFIFHPRSFVPFAAVDAKGEIFYFLTDQVGLPHELVDEDGRTVWAALYGAFGETKSARGNGLSNPIRFPNQYYDGETGLSYTRYRYYDPRAKAFISQDPLGPLAGDNVYDYGLNPWTWIDPYGLICLDNNLLSQAQQGNPAAIAFLNANPGNLRFGRAARNEFLKKYSQRELSQLSRNFGLVFDESANYRNVMNDATNLRNRFAGTNPPRRMGMMDSRQAAEARALGEPLATNDLGLYKRASDLGVPVQYVDSFPGPTGPSKAAQKAANYVPQPP